VRGDGAPLPYVPEQMPDGVADPLLINAIRREFDKIQSTFRLVSDFEVLHIAPPKPREGMVRFADGTDWNPGSGAGIYEYRGAAWHKL